MDLIAEINKLADFAENNGFVLKLSAGTHRSLVGGQRWSMTVGDADWRGTDRQWFRPNASDDLTPDLLRAAKDWMQNRIIARREEADSPSPKYIDMQLTPVGEAFAARLKTKSEGIPTLAHPEDKAFAKVMQKAGYWPSLTVNDAKAVKDRAEQSQRGMEAIGRTIWGRMGQWVLMDGVFSIHGSVKRLPPDAGGYMFFEAPLDETVYGLIRDISACELRFDVGHVQHAVNMHVSQFVKDQPTADAPARLQMNMVAMKSFGSDPVPITPATATWRIPDSGTATKAVAVV